MRFKTNERRRKIFFTQHLDFTRITFSSATDLQLISNELIALRPWVVREAEVRGEGEIGVNKKGGLLLPPPHTYGAKGTYFLWRCPHEEGLWNIGQLRAFLCNVGSFWVCKKIQFWQILIKLSWNRLVQPMFATTLVKPNSTVRRWKKKFPPSHPPPPPHNQPQQPTLSGLLIGTHCSSFFAPPSLSPNPHLQRKKGKEFAPLSRIQTEKK